MATEAVSGSPRLNIMPPPAVAEGDDEGRRLAEAKQIVKQEAFRMKRALDQRNLRDALKHA